METVQLLEVLSLCRMLTRLRSRCRLSSVFFPPWLSQSLVQRRRHPVAYCCGTTPSASSLHHCTPSCNASAVLLPSGGLLKYPPALLAALARVLSADSHNPGTIGPFWINFPKRPCSLPNSSKTRSVPAFFFEVVPVATCSHQFKLKHHANSAPFTSSLSCPHTRGGDDGAG